MAYKVFITAIGTDSGKTLVSAIVARALRADYWKPIQAGTPTDASYVLPYIEAHGGKVWPEAYKLLRPESPHAAAAADGLTIAVSDFTLPETNNNLVVEGAGGLLVPINDQDTIADLIHKLQLPVILVCNLYLGSINHSLLTIAELNRRRIPVRGIVFNGTPNEASESIILKHSGYKLLLKIKPETEINEAVVNKYANEIAPLLAYGRC